MGHQILPTPCIHGDGKGLCPACQHDFDEDPSAWEEFGRHPQGLANWQALQAEIAADALADPPTERPDLTQIPF